MESETVLYDDKGYPSIMNIIPKLSYKDVGLSDSTKALPAFMVDDAEKPEIFVGTFMAMVHDGRACSLPGRSAESLYQHGPGYRLIVVQKVRAGIV
ncbi:MAG: hypothetical protein ACLU2Y_13100 [Blautia massiliensis (ex Durand et al. 2017)]|uniref:hypothetical protein n=1 Tax=Blautia massiliensis (ex Durand et al. 2017) TaxID=1737424 RepID=UPI00399D3E73